MSEDIDLDAIPRRRFLDPEAADDRRDPVKAVEALQRDAPLCWCSRYLKELLAATASERRRALIEKNLLRVEFVNLQHELVQQEVRRKAEFAAVPVLAGLGDVKESLPPRKLGPDPYPVACAAHLFAAHIALQFHITNAAEGQRLQNVHVCVQYLGDLGLYLQDSELSLKALGQNHTGNCWVVFQTSEPTAALGTEFGCKLRFSAVTDEGGTTLEEAPLANLVLLREG
mmetsp:Transcript_12506/g.37172  ORF Transcript_12506/g.37172 Transcript_12506/m.37172 type:complete len:228 (+) Transcript_12506:472-1155(+)